MKTKILVLGIVLSLLSSGLIVSIGGETTEGREKVNESVESGTELKDLADSPWPMFHGGLNHSGQSPYDTSYVDGTEKWDFSTGDDVHSSPAIGPDGTIYVGSNDNNLYAVNPNGTEKWSFRTSHPSFDDWVYSSPAIDSDGTIYVGSLDNNLYAVHPNGTEKWSFESDSYVYSSPAIGSDDTIYFTDYDGNLSALYPWGTRKWIFDAGYLIRSSPAIGPDGTIYVGSGDNHLYAVHPNGTEKWSYETGGDVESSPAIGPDGTIYVGSNDGNLYALHPNGTEKWNFYTFDNVESSPAIGSDGTIYFGSNDNNLYALDPDGSKKWNISTGDDVVSSPAIGSNGTIYFGSDDNNLYALNPDGSKKWELSTGAFVESSPAIGSNGRIYVGSYDDNLYAIGGPNDAPKSPTNPSPPDEETGTNTSLTLSVDVSDPDGDTMDVSFYNASDDSVIDSNSGVSNGTTSITWSGLSYDTTYQWYAVADDGQASIQSDTWSFTTKTGPNDPPDAPTNPSPADGATGVSTSPTLSVDASDPDGDYMAVSFYDASDDTLIDTDNSVADGGTASVTWSALSYDTTYQWYAVADDGEATNQSDVWSFTTETGPNDPPDAPTNPSPTDGATGVGTSPTLSVDVSDPDGDYMDVSFYDGSDDTLIDTDSSVADGGTASVTWPSLSFDTTYQWYAVANDGQTTNQSDAWSFTTETGGNNPPDAPTNPSPTDGATGVSTSPTLSVDVSDPDGDSMNVSFYDASDDTLIDTDSGVADGSTASITWSGLSFDTNYQWYAVANDGQATNQSDAWSFTTKTETNTAPDAPTNPSPTDGATGVSTSPTLSVDVSDPDGDYMDVSFYDASDDTLIDTDSGVVDGSTASITWSGLSFDTNYQWYAVANDGQATNQSDAWSFTTKTETNTVPDVPTNPSPTDGETGVSTSPTLSVDVSDPDGDYMDVSFYDASDDTLIDTDSGVADGGTASITWSALSFDTNYQWYAVADDGQATNQSDAWSFTTETGGNNPPDAPTNPSPTDGATGVGTNPTLSVDISDPDGDAMNVSFYNASDDSPIGTDSNVPSDTRAQLNWTALESGTVYEWYAVAEDGEYSISSEVWNFTTVDHYDLTISVEGQGTTEPSSGIHSYEKGSEVNVEANPDQGWQFVEWKGAVSGTDPTINVTMDADKNITAIFQESSQTDKPSVPQNLQASTGDEEVELTWDAPSDNGGSSIIEYRIYRGTSSDSLTLLTNVTSTSYTDQEIENNETYYYQVSAVNEVGEGDSSAEVSATPTYSGTDGGDEEDTGSEESFLESYWWLIAAIVIGLIAVIGLIGRKRQRPPEDQQEEEQLTEESETEESLPPSEEESYQQDEESPPPPETE